MSITITPSFLLFSNGNTSIQTTAMIGSAEGYGWKLVEQNTVTLSFNNWVSTPGLGTTTGYGTYGNESGFLFNLQWGYSGSTEYSYFSGCDICGGDGLMAGVYSYSDYRELRGCGSYGEQVYFRLGYGTGGAAGHVQLYYFGRAGYGNTYTAPTATYKIYRLTVSATET